MRTAAPPREKLNLSAEVVDRAMSAGPEASIEGGPVSPRHAASR
jgi:hypothetical protein